jgi:hypothetical protein
VPFYFTFQQKKTKKKQKQQQQQQQQKKDFLRTLQQYKFLEIHLHADNIAHT